MRESDVEVGWTDTDMDENWMLMTSGSEVKSIEAHCWLRDHYLAR